MTIDIEKLIADIDEDGSGEIEYAEFKSLLQSTDWFNPTLVLVFHLNLDNQIQNAKFNPRFQHLYINVNFKLSKR